jgi:hypothetical protein
MVIFSMYRNHHFRKKNIIFSSLFASNLTNKIIKIDRKNEIQK